MTSSAASPLDTPAHPPPNDGMTQLAQAPTAADLLAQGHTPMMAHYPRMTYKCASVLDFFR